MAGQQPSDILRKAAKLIEDPDRWAKGARARDTEGYAVEAKDPTATSWCLEGAIAITCNPFGILPPYFMVLLDSVAEEYFDFPWGAPRFNEYYSHESVIRLLEIAAIKSERTECQR